MSATKQTPTKGALKRAELLKLARQALISHGYDELVLRDIANQAGIRLGNLQYYFPTREDLVSAIFLAEAEVDIQELKGMVDPDQDPRQQVSTLLKHIIPKWSGESGQVFRTMTYLRQHNKNYEPIYDQVYGAFFEAQGDLLARIQPGLTKKQYRAKNRLICALVDGTTTQTLGRDAKAHIEAVVQLAIHIAET